ncbi:hypothetical protein EI94DRAFT_1708003 [Lactarius quietus]|nr:hypothetical protein EI94DRAFT_1708003 [Lactarius quietus]
MVGAIPFSPLDGGVVTVVVLADIGMVGGSRGRVPWRDMVQVNIFPGMTSGVGLIGADTVFDPKESGWSTTIDDECDGGCSVFRVLRIGDVPVTYSPIVHDGYELRSTCMPLMVGVESEIVVGAFCRDIVPFIVTSFPDPGDGAFYMGRKVVKGAMLDGDECIVIQDVHEFRVVRHGVCYTCFRVWLSQVEGYGNFWNKGVIWNSMERIRRGHSPQMCKASGQYPVQTYQLSKPPKVMGGCARLWVNTLSEHIICPNPQRSWVDVQGFGSIPCPNISTVRTPETHGSCWVDVQGFGSIPCWNTSSIRTPEGHGCPGWMCKASGQYPVQTHQLSKPLKVMGGCSRLRANTLSEYILGSDPQRSWVDVQGFGSTSCPTTSSVRTPEAHGWKCKTSAHGSCWVDVQGFGSIPCLNTSTVRTPEGHGCMCKASGQHPVRTHPWFRPTKVMGACARLRVNILSDHILCSDPEGHGWMCKTLGQYPVQAHHLLEPPKVIGGYARLRVNTLSEYILGSDSHSSWVDVQGFRMKIDVFTQFWNRFKHTPSVKTSGACIQLHYGIRQ